MRGLKRTSGLTLALLVTTAVAQSHWTSWYPIGGTNAPDLRSIAWSGNRLVAVGNTGTVMTSQDGINWSLGVSGTTRRLNAVTWTGTQFAAVGDTGVFLTSPDGLIWTTRNTGQGENRNLLSLCWNGSKIVAVGDSGAIWTSADGIAWSLANSGTTSTFNSVSSSGTLTVAVGTTGTIRSSTDGIVWTSRTPTGTTEQLRSVAFAGTKFIAVAAALVNLTSPDGITWTRKISPSSGFVFNLTWTGAQLVGFGPLSTVKVLMGDDYWAWATDLPETETGFNSLVWSGTQFVAVGNGGIIMTSPQVTPVAVPPPHSLRPKGTLLMRFTSSRLIAEIPSDLRDPNTRAKIYSVAGIKMAEASIPENGVLSIPVGHLPRGVYMLELGHGITRATQRFTLSH